MKDKNSAIFIDRKINRVTFKDMRFGECDDAPGQFVPGATTILQAAPKDYSYYEWLKKYGNATDTLTAEAMEKGSKVHQATEDFDKGLPLTFMDEHERPLFSRDEWDMVHRYVEFVEKHNPEILINESTYSLLSLGYSGTIDRIMRINGEVWLIDIKTGQTYEYYWMQLAAYKKLFEAWQQHEYKKIVLPIDRVGILHLNAKTRGEDKKGKDIQGKGWCLEVPESWMANNPMEYYWDVFLATKKVWSFQNPTYKPDNRTFNLVLQKGVVEEVK